MILTKLFRLSVVSSIVIVSVSCASHHQRESGKHTQQFQVTESFLKSDQISPPQNPVSEDIVQQAQEFVSRTIPTMGTMQRGAPLLTQLPRFASEQPFKVSLNEMEIPQLAHYVLGDLLGLNYVLSTDVEQMKDKIALNLQKDVTPAELFDITRQVLTQQSVDVFTKDNIVFLARKARGGASRSVGIGGAIEDMPETGDDILQLVPFTFNTARGVNNIVSKLTNAVVVPDNNNRLLIVEGSRSDVERALQIIAMLDVPHARGRDIRMLSLAYLSPDELISQVTSLVQAEGLIIGEDIALVALNRINAVVVYSGNKTLGDRVSMWARTLDVSSGGETDRFYVYRPKFAQAVELSKSLQLFLQTPAGPEPAGRPAAAGRATNNLVINADESQNALIIRGTPSRYREVIALLEQLDRLPGQVALQVVVAEVELSDNISTGIDWFYNSVSDFDKSARVDLNSGAGTLALQAFRGDWRVALNFLATQTDLRVLSRPYLVVRDGQSASINSGQQVPVVTETNSSNQSPDSIRTSVQYRSTGISLSVTPIINADGLVSLQISQETSKSEPTQGFEVATPTILTRNINTSVLVADGQTIVLGGLIKEDITDNDSRVPILGSIPLLGKLFQTKGERFSRTELMVLITPRIIRETSDLDEFGRKLSELYSFPVNP